MQLHLDLLAKVLFSLLLVVIGTQGRLPKYCNQTIKQPFFWLASKKIFFIIFCRAKDSARYSFQKTMISVITPRCSLNGMSWRKPRFKHVVVFFKQNWSFQLCFTVHSPGASIYRLKGASKQPVASLNMSGSLGCLESHCKHLTLQLESPAGSAIRRIDYTFSYLRIYSKTDLLFSQKL